MSETPGPADILAHLGRRYSVGPKYLGQPAPDAAQLRSAARLALRAPDHGGLRPFRFIAISPAQRERLGELFAAGARRRGREADEIEQARRRAHNGPGLVALVAHLHEGVEDVPVAEQWLATGAGLMNFLNALHLMGYGAKVLSGASVYDQELQAAFCGAGETLLAWIVTGTPQRSTHPRHEDEVELVFSEWKP